MPKIPLRPANAERVCWGCDKYCSADDLACGNGTIRTAHPCELFGLSRDESPSAWRSPYRLGIGLQHRRCIEGRVERHADEPHLTALRVTMLFSLERAAPPSIGTGRLAAWWLNHGGLWFAVMLSAWIAAMFALGVAGARRRFDL